MPAPVLIAAFGETKNPTAWARDDRCVVSVNTLKKRLADGWAPETAITTPAPRGQGRRGVPLTDKQVAELRDAAEKVRRGPKVHRHTPPDAPEAVAMRERDELICAAIARKTSLSEIGRTVRLSGAQIAAIRDAHDDQPSNV